MAATGSDMSNDLGVDGKGERGTEIRNGLASPEPTPGVDDGRIEAEKVRQAAEAALANAKTGNPPGGGEDDEDEEERKRDPTEEQNKAIQEVLKWKANEYRKILGVHDNYVSSEEEQEEILNALRTLGTLIHPDHVKGKNTEKAHKRVLKAAAQLGVDKEDINEVRTWDGVEDIFGMEGMEDTNKEIPWPTDFVLQIYQSATPHLGKLLVDSTDPDALAELITLNHKIKEQNEKDGIEPNQWTIDFVMYGANFNSVKPYYDRLVNTPEGQPLDEEAKKKIEELNVSLKKINAKHHFPDNWCVNAIEEARAAKVAQTGTEAGKLEAERLAAEKAAAEKAAADKVAADKATADKATSKKFGNIEFPWVTYPLPTGERIISGRQRTKDDVSGSLCCVELPCTDPKDPTFEFRDDIDIFELQKYFATPGIKLMGETDEKGRPVKVWRKVDRKDFREFLFCVVGKRERSDLRKRTTPVCPEVLCGVVMADGVTVLNKTGLLNMVGKKAEEGYIRRYCEKKGITSPWDVKPNSWTIADEDKELLDKLKSERLNSAPAGNSTSGNPTAGSSEIKSVGDKLAALERRIEALQAPSTGGRSLDEIFSKLEALETRVAKVDVLSEKMDKTTKILDALCVKIGLA